VLAHTGDSFVLADLAATGSNGGLDTGNVIVSWVRYVTFAGAKHLWAQKLDPDGAPLWGAGHRQVFDLAGGSLQFGNFPGFESDGAGGAVFVWYTSTPSLQVRAQRILSAGTEAFAHDGVEVSTDGTRLRVDPSVAFDPGSEETTIFWVEKNSLQSQHGLYGQRLDVSGARLWGATGLAFVALSGTEVTQARALPALTITLAASPEGGSGGDVFVAWAETVAFDHQPIRAARVSAAGAFVWEPAIVTLKSSGTSTSRLSAATSSDGFAAFSWTDSESARDLEAQNLNLDGTLGLPLFVDGFESSDTSAWSTTVP
jgi:hypothetical protein